MLQPVYRGKHLNYYRAPDGWEYVERAKAAAGIAIVAITREHRLLVVEQYRTPLKRAVIELPGGVIDPGETPDDTVRKELLQETGYTCASVTQLAEVVLSPGLVNEINIICRAGGLTRQETSNKDTIDGRVVAHGHIHGLTHEHERIRTWEVPLEDVPAWLEQRRRDGVAIDLRIYAGLHFAQQTE